jgi:uncharacterized damage-inducible protein DinB
MQQYFKTLFDYDKWATDALMEKFEHQFPQNERIYELLSHMLSAKRVWFERCAGLPQSVAIWAKRLPEEIKADAETYHLDWMAFIDSLQPDEFGKDIHYANSRGEEYDNKLSDIMAHVINHGTHHRGQLIIMMKDEGFVLPGIDYITFIR